MGSPFNSRVRTKVMKCGFGFEINGPRNKILKHFSFVYLTNRESSGIILGDFKVLPAIPIKMINHLMMMINSL